MPTVLTDLNWLAILIASVSFFILGAIWYSFLFGKKWVEYHGINVNDDNAKAGMAGIMTGSFLLMVVDVICLAILVKIIGLNGVVPGVKLGLLVGVGFAATAISIGYLYTKKPVGLHLIDGLYHITGNVIAAIILCIW